MVIGQLSCKKSLRLLETSVADPDVFTGSGIFDPDPAPDPAIHNYLYVKKVGLFLPIP